MSSENDGGIIPLEPDDVNSDSSGENNDNDIVDYLEDINNLFSEDVYTEFQSLMKRYQEKEIDTTDLKGEIANLFRGHGNMIIGFNSFLGDEKFTSEELRDLNLDDEGNELGNGETSTENIAELPGGENGENIRTEESGNGLYEEVEIEKRKEFNDDDVEVEQEAEDGLEDRKGTEQEDSNGDNLEDMNNTPKGNENEENIMGEDAGVLGREEKDNAMQLEGTSEEISEREPDLSKEGNVSEISNEKVAENEQNSSTQKQNDNHMEVLPGREVQLESMENSTTNKGENLISSISNESVSIQPLNQVNSTVREETIPKDTNFTVDPEEVVGDEGAEEITRVSENDSRGIEKGEIKSKENNEQNVGTDMEIVKAELENGNLVTDSDNLENPTETGQQGLSHENDLTNPAEKSFEGVATTFPNSNSNLATTVQEHLPIPPSIAPTVEINQPPNPAENFNQATEYVRKIKERFEEARYKEFLNILHNFQKQNIEITQVVNEVVTLFAGHYDLLDDFHHFLPEAHRNEALGLLRNSQSQLHQVPSSDPAPPPEVAHLPPPNTLQMPSQPTEPPQMNVHHAPHPIAPSGISQSQHDPHPVGTEGIGQVQSQEPSNRMIQEQVNNQVDGNVLNMQHLDQHENPVYTSTTSVNASQQPLENSSGLEVHQVEGQMEATQNQIPEMSQFPPGQGPMGGTQPDPNGNYANYPINDPYQQQFITGYPQHFQNAPMDVMHGMPPPQNVAPQIGPYGQGLVGHISGITGTNGLMNRRLDMLPSDAKKKRTQMNKAVRNLKKAPWDGLVPPYGYNVSQERAFFEQVREVFDKDQKDQDSKWYQFLQELEAYNQDMTLKSREDLQLACQPIFKNHPALFKEFKIILNAKGAPENVTNELWYFMPLSEIDFSQCRKCTPSYRALPSEYPRPPSSERSPEEDLVLNDVWVSVPVGSEDSASFKHMKRNQFEEQIFRCEDDRFEIDMVIDSNLSTIRIMEPLVQEIEQLNMQQKEQYESLSLRNSQLDARQTLESPFTKPAPFQYKLEKGTFSAIHYNAIARIYGEQNGIEILQLLRSNPAGALPVILRRLKQKDIEWRKSKADLNKQWKEIMDKNYHKSLDHRGNDFKNKDKKALASKGLFSEIIGKRKEQIKAINSILEYDKSPSLLELTQISYFVLDNHSKCMQTSLKRDRDGNMKEEGTNSNESNIVKEEMENDQTSTNTINDNEGKTRENVDEMMSSQGGSKNNDRPRESPVNLDLSKGFGFPQYLERHNCSSKGLSFHADAYKLICYAVENMIPAPGDKEKIMRAWREYIAYFFELNVNNGEPNTEAQSSVDSLNNSSTSMTKESDKVMILTGAQYVLLRLYMKLYERLKNAYDLCDQVDILSQTRIEHPIKKIFVDENEDDEVLQMDEDELKEKLSLYKDYKEDKENVEAKMNGDDNTRDVEDSNFKKNMAQSSDKDKSNLMEEEKAELSEEFKDGKDISNLENLVVDIYGDSKRTKSPGYEAYFAILFSLLDGGVDSVKYEETVRQTLGQHAFMLSTMDKVLSNLLRQLLVVINDDNEGTNMHCLQLFKEREQKSLGHILSHADTLQALNLILSASERTRSEEAFKISFLQGPKTIGSAKRNKVIRIREDIVLFEYITLDAEGDTYKLEKENNFISDSIRLLKQEDEGGDLHQSSDRESVIESEEEDGGQEPENNNESEPAKKRSKLNATDSNSEAKDNTLSEEN